MSETPDADGFLGDPNVSWKDCEPYKQREKPCPKCRHSGPHYFHWDALSRCFKLRCVCCRYDWTFREEVKP